MLITLATVDSVLIVVFILEKAVVDEFSPEEPLWYAVAFPQLLHPLREISITGTIFMIVAISTERYRAICHPMSQRHKVQFLTRCCTSLI